MRWSRRWRRDGPAPGLPEVLARSGIDRLVVRNDLDWAATGSPRPAVVHAALDGTEGLRRTAQFGPLVQPYADLPGVVGYELDRPYPAVEVYEVVPQVLGVRAVELADVPVLTGGPESLMPAVAAGALAADEPVVLAGDDPVSGVGRWILTDGLRRRERNIGRIQGNLSVTMAPDAAQRVQRRAVDLLPFDPAGHQTVARPRGVAAVSATTSAAFADALDPVRTEYAPAAALDGNLYTTWRSSQAGSPVGQSLSIELVRPTDLDGTTVVVENNILLGPRVTRLEAVTDTGRAVTQVPASGSVELDVPDGPSRTLTLRVDGVEPGAGRVGIAEVAIPGVTASAASLQLPADVPPSLPRSDSGTASVVLADDQPPRRACVPTGERPGLVRCDPGLSRGGEDQAGLDRVLDLDRGDRYTLSGTAVAGSGTALAGYFGSLGPALVATASSVLDDQVVVRAGAAVDGDRGTAWVAAPSDIVPTIELGWPQERTVSTLTVVAAEEPLAARPQRLELSTPSRTWQVDLAAGPTTTFAPVETDRLTVRVLAWERSRSFNPVTGLTSDVPPGIAELELDGGVSSFRYPPDPTTRIGQVCGTGPTVRVDGRRVPTTVDASLADLQDGREIAWSACEVDDLALASGRHHVQVEAAPQWDVSRVVLERSGAGRSRTGPAERGVEVRTWATSERRVVVASGAEALLVVPEGANPGWRARLDGATLRPQTVDGWQQGWVLPAGAGGEVVLEYVPQRDHVRGLAIGAVLALLVLGLAVAPGRRGTRALDGTRRAAAARAHRARAGRAFGAAGSGWWQRLAWGIGGFVPVLLAGPWGVLAVAIGWGVSRVPRVRAVGVALMCVAAGVAVAWSQQGSGGAPDTSPVVQVLVLTAFATTWWTAARVDPPRERTAT